MNHNAGRTVDIPRRWGYPFDIPVDERPNNWSQLSNGVYMPEYSFEADHDSEDSPTEADGSATTVNVETIRRIKEAIQRGFRHLGANCSTEVELGQAVKESIADKVVERGDLFISTRVKASADIPSAFQKSLDKMELGYIDLYLLSPPGDMAMCKSILESDEEYFNKAWEHMENIYGEETPPENRTAKAIGYSLLYGKPITRCNTRPHVCQLRHFFNDDNGTKAGMELVKNLQDKKVAVQCLSHGQIQLDKNDRSTLTKELKKMRYTNPSVWGRVNVILIQWQLSQRVFPILQHRHWEYMDDYILAYDNEYSVPPSLLQKSDYEVISDCMTENARIRSS